VCFGGNENNQLGYGTTVRYSCSLTPLAVHFDYKFWSKPLTSRFLLPHVCIDCSVGSAPDAPVAEYAVDFGASKVSDVDCGVNHTCVLLDSGTTDATVKCFGGNRVYQLVSYSLFSHHSSLLSACMCLRAVM
jgi:Regulator of chromosome condensation (RCC1) repeat